MNRGDARVAAVKLVYEWEMGGEGGEETRLGLLNVQPDEPEAGYMEKLLEQVKEHAEELDGEIEAHAIGWTLDRISRVDLCILRVALCEMKHMALPPAVAINEALELARAYSTPEAVTFINGVLGNIARETQA